MRTLLILGLAAVLVTSRAPGQAPATCPPDQISAFDFLVGQWQGTVFDLKGTDSTRAAPTGHITTAKVLAGCALEERWHYEANGQTEADVLVLRAYDAGTRSWSYDLATSRNEHLTYLGRFQDGAWHFYYDRVADGKTDGIQIWWVPTATGYSERIAHSADGGLTWTSTRHINFVRAIAAR